MRVAHTTRSISSIITRLSLFPKHLQRRNRRKTSRRSHFLSTHRCYSSTMAGDSETLSTVAAEVTAKYGFERPEMYQSSLPGTVDQYDRHVFLCYKSHDSWPSRVEKSDPDSDSDSDPLPKLFVSALKARKDDITVKTRLTICEGGYDVKFSDGDVLIFPEMIVYRGLKGSDIDSFVENVLVNGKPWLSGVQEDLTGSYVFVCAHKNRDRRCGFCGPILIEKCKEEIVSKDLKDHVFVIACSHVGGHKYAGNVITFCADHNGKIAGNWYGYVTPGDVLELLDIQIGKGEVIDRIWRGQMGAIVIEAVQAEEPKHANETTTALSEEPKHANETTTTLSEEPKHANETTTALSEEPKHANETITAISEEPPLETAIEETTEDVGSCCQGPNGFSCCRDDNVEKKETSEKRTGGGVSFSCWMDKLEQRHFLTTVAVVGSVAAIAVAYGYRRAR